VLNASLCLFYARSVSHGNRVHLILSSNYRVRGASGLWGSRRKVRRSCQQHVPRLFPKRRGRTRPSALKGVRGPRGGYELAGERRRITVGEIVRIAMSLSTADPDDLSANSPLLERVIDPAIRRAGETFLANLDAISVEQMCETAEKSHVVDDEKVSDAFAI
jgi:hypothetical protein